MAEPTQGELAEIEAERAAMFRPDWLIRLAQGRLALGETFFGGFLGVQLVLMPLWLVLVVAIPAFAPGLGWGTILGFYLLQALWTAVVTQAVIRVGLRSGEAGLWRFVAMALAVGTLVMVLWLLRKWLTGAL